jgi:hypothetical protein
LGALLAHACLALLTIHGLFSRLYSAYGPRSSRVAIAVSEDRWLVDFNVFNN